MRPLITTFCLFFSILPCFAQTDSTRAHPVTNSIGRWRQVSIAILAGYNYYGRTAGELGISKK
ncbi:MAG TPA: hypothetical protein VHB48_21300 [Chitinophagaceae bacterium]|nr:hypothetical protein [Chitinophagaceae bacterium]